MNNIILPIFLLTMILAQENTTNFDESFDPLQLDEPELEWPMMIWPDSVVQIKAPQVSPDSTVQGYRIQVISTKDYEIAEGIRDSLIYQFGEEIYVVFDSPNYKVRVGNFTNRSEAEKIQQQIVQMGYKSTWIIRTKVIYKPKVW